MVVVVKDVESRFPTPRDKLTAGDPFIMMARDTATDVYYTYSVLKSATINNEAVFISKGLYNINGSGLNGVVVYTVAFTLNSDKTLNGIGLEYNDISRTMTENTILSGTSKFYLANSSGSSGTLTLGTPGSSDTVVTSTMFIPNDSSLDKGELVAGKFYTLIDKDGNPAIIKAIAKANSNLFGGATSYTNEINISTFDIFFIPYSKTTSIYESGKCTPCTYAYVPFKIISDSMVSTATTSAAASGCDTLTKDSHNCMFIGTECTVTPPKDPEDPVDEAKAAKQKIIIIATGVGIIMFMLLLMVILLRR